MTGHTERSALVGNLQDGVEFADMVGYPVLLSPSFTLLGSGGGVCRNSEDLSALLLRALELSPVHEVLIEVLK